MKAIVQDKYGSPDDVLELQDIDKPVVKDDEVLVRVHAASVHIGDWIIMRGMPYIMRMASGLRRPKNSVPGMDIAGHVEGVGNNVKQLQPGDEVFGWCKGAFAEYACAGEDNFVQKPVNLTFEQAAAVGVSAFTALQALRDQGKVQQGRPFVSMTNKEDLVVLKELIEAGKVTPVIDRTYPLSETPEAMGYVGEGHARGKIVITVEHNNKT